MVAESVRFRNPHRRRAEYFINETFARCTNLHPFLYPPPPNFIFMYIIRASLGHWSALLEALSPMNRLNISHFGGEVGGEEEEEEEEGEGR